MDREALARRRRARRPDLWCAAPGGTDRSGGSGIVVAPYATARTLVDSHCHLGDPAFDSDRDAVLTRARAAGVSHVVAIGESLAGSERSLTIAHSRGGISATAGVHPHEAGSWSPETHARIRDLLAAPEIVAVGETGLDYHYMHAPAEAQRAAFEAHLALGVETGKPVVVHSRDADADMAAMLRALAPRPPVVILHSFSSGDAVWDAGLAIGAYFSFSGMITFKNWMQADRLSAVAPDRLLVETDAPYLAPVPHRGKRNEPAFVAAVAERAAAIRGEDLQALSRRTTDNARRCFGARLDTSL